MTPVRFTATRIGFAAGSMLAVSLLSGCSASRIHSASAALPEGASSQLDSKAEKAVIRAEQAVRRSPQDAGARNALGLAYLGAGRFDSAATALNDAMALGDNTGRTALALALAQIGQGRHADAVALLDDWRSDIPAGDLGLALALAGETSRGVAVLVDAVRTGDNSAKLRQNLAYAYALDGRWQESRTMAAQDVPADQLDRRIAFWALSTLPDRNKERIAVLLGAPLRGDPGQPAALALTADPAKEQLAAETAAPVAAAAPPVLAEAAPAPAVAAPLVTTVSANIAAQQATPGYIAPAPAALVQPRTSVAQAFGSVEPVVAQPAAVQPVKVVRAKVAAGGTHFVQLGAFSSLQGARRAWGIYTRQDRSLRAYRMTITPTNVRGKNVWRVAAGGLVGRMAANNLCAGFKTHGGTCFAYAAPRKFIPAAPGVPGVVAGGPQMARRR